MSAVHLPARARSMSAVCLTRQFSESRSSRKTSLPRGLPFRLHSLDVCVCVCTLGVCVLEIGRHAWSTLVASVVHARLASFSDVRVLQSPVIRATQQVFAAR